jgi:hypothetical protein
VEPIGVEDLGRLGINADHELFWDGRRIEVRRSLVLTGLQKTVAAVVTVAAILGGLGSLASGLNNAAIFACARGISFFHCPARGTAP